MLKYYSEQWGNGGVSMQRYKIADIVFTAKYTYPYLKKICANYEYDGDEPSKTIIEVTKEDIEMEKSHFSVLDFPDAYYESLALYRKFLAYMMTNDAIILHSSALAIDGEAFLFTAPSGTGKSTHAKLYRQVFGDRVTMINDDKPIIRLVGEDFYVYGTPWNGKHNLDTNTRVKIKAICNLKQAKENSIKQISKAQMLMVLINQTLRPKEESEVDKLFTILDKLLNKVGLYELYCNISEEAVKLSYKTMSRESKDED